MIRGLYTSVSGLIAQEAKQDIITNNLANVNTVGFKTDNLSVKKFNDVLIENYDKVVNGKNVRNVIGSISQGSQIDGVSTSFSQGMIQNTDKPTDFAIEGNGFFAVSRNTNGNTKEYYSRDGHFFINNDGYLVNNSGDNVLGTNKQTGAVEPIKVGKGNIQCDSKGNIDITGNDNAADDRSYKMRLVNFDNINSLLKAGDNLYEGQAPIESNNIVVRQNNLEKSNVNVMNEMANMMTVMRTFESNQKMVQSIDETLNKAVNEVGTVR